MAATTVRQTMFTMGQVDPINYKRTDYKDYLKAAKILKNAEVGTTGLAKKRRGTRFISSITSYLPEQNSKIYEFSDKDNNFYLILSVNLAMHIFKIVDDTLVFQQSVVTPYTSSDIGDLDYTEDNDSIVFASNNFIPSRLFVSDYIVLTFAFEPLNIFPFPAVDFGRVLYRALIVSLAGNNVTNTLTITSVTDPGFTTAWIGGQITGGGDSIEDPIGYGIISNVVPWNGAVTVFTIDVKTPFRIAGASTKGSEYSIRQPAWSNILGYPSSVAFYQNRLWLGSTRELPVTIFGSVIGQPINFDVGTAGETDAIIDRLSKSNTGRITWINPGKQLEIYSENEEYVAPQDTGTALTPASFYMKPQSSYGGSTQFKPINYINDSYFVNKTGNALINYRFNGIGQTYTSSNVSAVSSKLIKKPKNRALQRGTDNSQDNFIYILNSDETITTFQFAMQQGLAALSTAEFEQDIEVIDLVNINNEIYFLKKYIKTNSYSIEKFIEDYKIDGYLDSTMDADGLILIDPMYEGYTVQIIFDNQDFGQYVVEGGQVIADNVNRFSGSVVYGFIYPFEIETMNIFYGENRSNWAKHLTQINVDYFESLNFYINNKLVPYQKYSLIQAGLPLVLQTDTAIIYPARGWDRFSTVKITQNSPFNCEILGISYEINGNII